MIIRGSQLCLLQGRWLVGWMAGELFSWLIGWLVDWSVGWLVGWLIDLLFSWLTSLLGRLFRQLVRLTCAHACSVCSNFCFFACFENYFGTDRNTLLSLLTCSLPFFAQLYLLSVSAWFTTALLSLGTRLGSPPRHFYGGGGQRAPHKNYGGELLFACSALLC